MKITIEQNCLCPEVMYFMWQCDPTHIIIEDCYVGDEVYASFVHDDNLNVIEYSNEILLPIYLPHCKKIDITSNYFEYDDICKFYPGLEEITIWY